MNDEFFMKKAIELSVSAGERGNEPFGAVLVKNGEIVGENENQIHTAHDPFWHAESGLLQKFMKETGITDLREYTMYASCEPCFMCSGMLVWAKIGRVVYGASNIDLQEVVGRQGCNCSAMVFDNSFWHPEVTAGVLRDEAVDVLKKHFSTHPKA